MKQDLITIAIPVYNEIRGLKDLIDKTNNLSLNKEIILIDDGSVYKETREIIDNAFKKESRLKLIKNSKNIGKARSVKKAFKKSKGNLFVVLDGDSELDPDDIVKMYKKLKKSNARFINGTRVLKRRVDTKTNKFTRFSKRVVGLLIRIVYMKHVKDVLSAYKMFYIEDFKDFKWVSQRFGLETEILLHAIKRKLSIDEIDVEYNPRSFKEGKKINILDGGEILKMIILYRF